MSTNIIYNPISNEIKYTTNIQCVELKKTSVLILETIKLPIQFTEKFKIATFLFFLELKIT